MHPTIAAADLETAIVLLILNAVADDSRIALRSRSLPEALLIKGKGAPGEPCIERQEACNELLGIGTKMFDATSLELLILFEEEIKACARNGKLYLYLHRLMNSISACWLSPTTWD